MARFIVTGTPRSATGYASLLFRELAIPCSHERIFKPRGALADVLDWYEHNNAGESSWLAWAFLGLLPGKVPVLHTTRNPWAVVDSLAHRNDLIPKEACVDRGKKQLRDAITAYCPAVKEFDAPIDRATAFVLEWNQHIDRAVERHGFPYFRYRVEDMDAVQLGRILEFVDVYRDSYEIDAVLESLPRNVNEGKRIHYNVPVTRPELVAVMKEIAPDHPPEITKLVTADTSRTPDELEENMDPRLRDGLRELASRQGYDRDEIAVVSEQTEGVLTHGTQ